MVGLAAAAPPPWHCHGRHKLPNGTCPLPTRHHERAIVATKPRHPHPPAQPLHRKPSLAAQLGWVRAPGLNICNGYYREPAIVRAVAAPAAVKQSPTTITARHRAVLAKTGRSMLAGPVVVTQSGRKLTADKAYLYRNRHGKITHLELIGDVHLYEAGKLIISQHAWVNLVDKSGRLQQVTYRILRSEPYGDVNAWGQAQTAVHTAAGVLKLRHASYSTCPPTSNTWTIKAERLVLNPHLGWGKLYNGWLYVKHIPVMYLPFFSFPISHQRKSGFLLPTVKYNHRSGVDITQPFYINLAPNYDATLFTRAMTKRGVLLSALFRYLTPTSDGAFNINFLPSDRRFRQFRRSPASDFGMGGYTLHALARLREASDHRDYVHYHDHSDFNPHWSSSADINYVSDAYYFQDFSNTPTTATIDQLVNQASVAYQDRHWRFVGRVLAFQTLHPINQGPIVEQYRHLPQLDLTGQFPQLSMFNFYVNSEFVNFSHANNFASGLAVVTGQRYHLRPAISAPLLNAWGFFTPRVQLDLTSYDLKNQLPGRDNNVTRVLPIVDIDSGIYLQRHMHFFGRHYLQTLEPRIFYLYVPLDNQNDIPNFDTTLPIFGFNQLFRTNRFIGFDKIGDANQLSYGITSRFLDSYSGNEKLSASIGQSVYFKKPKVCFTPGCRGDMYIGKRVSPIVGQMNYHLNTDWNVVGNLAWQPHDQRFENGSVIFHYQDSAKRIFNAGYDFVRDGDTLSAQPESSEKNNLSRLDLSLSLPLHYHWQALAAWNYNLSHRHPQTYLYGLVYNSCCWALRFIVSRVLLAENDAGTPSYDTNYYVQLQLKGLGDLGNNDPRDILKQGIPGYHDTF